jgi:hypothetical protein
LNKLDDNEPEDNDDKTDSKSTPEAFPSKYSKNDAVRQNPKHIKIDVDGTGLQPPINPKLFDNPNSKKVPQAYFVNSL